MNVKPSAVHIAMISSLAIVLVLSFWPIATEWRYYRPDWLSLWLIFWALYYPNKLGIWLACLIGLLADLTTGSLLGSYALSSAIVVYASRRLGRNFMLMNIVEQTILVVFLVFLSLAVRLFLWWSFDVIAMTQAVHYIVVFFASLCVWPLFLDGLVRWQNRYLR